MRLSEDSAPKDMDKEYLIAQDYILHGTHYYCVKADTMGEAVALIENDPEVRPDHSEAHDIVIAGYTEAEDNYDS